MSARGSAFSSLDGRTYSMDDVIRRTSPCAIDVMLYYGTPSNYPETGFYLFAPDDPTITIDFDKQNGTKPYNLFEGWQRAPQGPGWLKNWEVRNATKMYISDSVNFDEATAECIAAIEMKNSYIAGSLKVGDVVVFETAATSANPSKKGLIKIDSIEDDNREEQAGQLHFSKINILVKIIR
jgi:hypothetical protein